MELFEIRDDNYAYPSEAIRAIPVFRKIITRDRGSDGDADGRKKLQASREFAWMHFMYNPMSPQQALPEDERKKKVGKLVFDDPGYKPDKTLEEAVEAYKDMVTTLPIRMLEAARKACYNLIEYLESVDLMEMDDNGKPIHKVADVIRALEKMGALVDEVDKLEERVRKKQKGKDRKVRGNVAINEFNS